MPTRAVSTLLAPNLCCFVSFAYFVVPTALSRLNRPNCREVLECGGWRGTGLTPLWMACGGPKRKRCMPSPLTHRTPKRWRADRGWHWFRGAWLVNLSGSFLPAKDHYQATQQPAADNKSACKANGARSSGLADQELMALMQVSFCVLAGEGVRQNSS